MAQPRLADYGMLLFLGLTWGSSFMLIGVALPSVPPITLTAIRCLLAAAALLAAVRVLGHAIPRGRRAWLSFLAMGLTNSALPFILISTGQLRIDSSLAAILIATVPLFTLVLAHFFAGDPSTPNRIAGVAIGFGGIVLLIGPSALAGIGADLLGQILVVGGALCFAVTQVLVKRHRGGSPVVGAACSIACSALWTIPLALLVEQPWRGAAPTAGAVAAVLVLGLLSTGVTHFVFFLLLQRTGPQFVTLNNYIAPSVGLVLGIVFLGENPHWTAYVALAVIVFGIYVATRTPRRPPAIAAPLRAEAR